MLLRKLTGRLYYQNTGVWFLRITHLTDTWTLCVWSVLCAMWDCDWEKKN